MSLTESPFKFVPTRHKQIQRAFESALFVLCLCEHKAAHRFHVHMLVKSHLAHLHECAALTRRMRVLADLAVSRLHSFLRMNQLVPLSRQ